MVLSSYLVTHQDYLVLKSRIGSVLAWFSASTLPFRSFCDRRTLKGTPMPIATQFRLRRIGASAAVGALAASGLVLAAPAQAVTFSTVTNLDVNTDETRATGHNEFLADGVRVHTEGSTSTDKAAGYFRVDQALETVGEPAMNWAANNGNGGTNLRPSVQLVVDYNGDGSADGILVGEPTYADGVLLYGNDWWLSNGSKQAFKNRAPVVGGGFGSDNHGTLDQWREAVPNARVLKAGWSLGSGVKGDGIISQIKVGNTAYRFAPAATSTQVVTSDQVDLASTRATGHHEFSKTGGVRVYTDGNTSTDKAAGYFDIGTPLAKAGAPSLDWTAAAGQPAVPGNQLKVDFDGDGTVDGTLVGEPVYGAQWWLADAKAFVKENAPRTGGGHGSNWFGTVGEWSDGFPNAVIVAGGWSLGSGVKGDGVINGITVGAVTYTFEAKNTAPTAANLTASTKAGKAVSISLPASDADDDALTYTVAAAGGVVSGAGATRTFTPAATFSGKAVVTYVVTDGRGGSATGTVTVSVAKLASKVTITRINPLTGKITAKKNVSVYATIRIDGKLAPAGTVVDGYAKGAKAVSGKTNSKGEVKLALGKLPKGKATLRVTLPGTSTVLKSQDAAVVRVK